MLRDAEAERHPDRAATVDYPFERWLEVADFELSTRLINVGYINRTLSPTICAYSLRKLHDRVDYSIGSTRPSAALFEAV